MELKNNQIEKSLQLLKVVKNYGIAYLWGEVRSGKTGTALNVAKLLGVKNTLIITKKKGAELLDLKTGDRVTVLFDEDADEWYIRKSDNGLITFSSRHCSLGFHSAILWNDLTKSTRSEKGGYIIASEPTIINKTKAYAILTSSAR